MLGDLNAKVGNLPVEEVVGGFGDLSINENGERLFQRCAERNLMVGNAYFKKKKP